MRVPIPGPSDVGKQLTALSAAPFTVAWRRASNYLGVFTDSTRDQAAVENSGDFIFNDDDKTFNIWDADVEMWRNPSGVLT